jgi:hypothetical protein
VKTGMVFLEVLLEKAFHTKRQSNMLLCQRCFTGKKMGKKIIESS